MEKATLIMMLDAADEILLLDIKLMLLGVGMTTINYILLSFSLHTFNPFLLLGTGLS